MRNSSLRLVVFSILSVMLVFAVGTTAQEATSPVVLPVSPYSTSLLVAQGIHNGTIQVPGVASQLPVFPTLTCSPAPCVVPNVQASGGTNIANEDPIASNPLNSQQLLTGANDYSCSASLQGFYASSDGGTTWTRTCLPVISGGSGLGDPMVGYDLLGNTFAGGIQANSTGQFIVVSTSTNNGTSWATPTIAVRPTLPSGGTTDKGWLEVDTNASSPHVNCLYISNTQFDASSNSEISVSHSCDGNKTWKTVVVDTKQIYPTNVDQFSDLAVGADGTVYVAWMRCPATGSTGDCGGTKATFYVSKSTDGGTTWSTPGVIATATLAPDSCGAFYGCLPNTSERVSNIPVIAIDNSTGTNAGHLYVAIYKWTGTKLRVGVTHSTDGGTTWSKLVPVAPTTAPNDEFFQWLNVSSAGTVGVSWLDRRNDPANLKYDAYAGFSINGGTGFVSNIKLTSVMSNPLNDGFGGAFMGDYSGDAWDGATFYASWMDSRNGRFMQDEVGGVLRRKP